MAKKKTTRPGRGGHPAGNATVPLNVYRAQRATATMAPAFVDWYTDGDGPSEEAVLYLDVATDVAASYLEIAGTAEVTAFEPEMLARLMDTLEAADPEAMRMAMSAFHLYVDFLRETGAWTGTADDLEACHELLIDVEEEDEDDVEQPVLVVPDVPEAEEAAYLATLPLIRQARALVDWVGEGKPVTRSGSLRLRDIEAAAACVGVAARGSRAVPTGEADVLVREGAGRELSGIQSVASMDRVPRLVAVMDALDGSALLEATGTRIASGVHAGLGGADPLALAAWRAFIGVYLWGTLFDSFSSRTWEGLYMVQASVLAAASSNEPVPVAEVPNLLAEVIAANVDEDGLGEPTGSELPDLAFRDFEDLAAAGLIELDSHVRIPRPVARSIAEALQDGFDFAVEYPESKARKEVPEPAPHRAGPADPGRTAHGSTAPVYQLKVQLKGSKPPIWRRLEVPSDLRLDQMHEVIQASFGWDDSHLHVFTVGGRHGQDYGPLDEDLAVDGGIDETTVRLAGILDAEGGKVDYVYDFGDDREHTVTLEKILPADTDPSHHLPRCTGGRCMAPLEDSGGIGGWEGMAAAANGPDHPGYQEVRGWFDLADGEQVDPKAFDRDQVNGRLRDVASRW